MESWWSAYGNLEGKAGLYSCDASNRGTFDADSSHFEGNGSTAQAAFLGEIGLSAVYRLTQRWSLTAGYQAMWLDGIALAPNQIAVTDIATQQGGITTDGYLFFQGASVGV